MVSLIVVALQPLDAICASIFPLMLTICATSAVSEISPSDLPSAASPSTAFQTALNATVWTRKSENGQGFRAGAATPPPFPSGRSSMYVPFHWRNPVFAHESSHGKSPLVSKQHPVTVIVSRTGDIMSESRDAVCVCEFAKLPMFWAAPPPPTPPPPIPPKPPNGRK